MAPPAALMPRCSRASPLSGSVFEGNRYPELIKLIKVFLKLNVGVDVVHFKPPRSSRSFHFICCGRVRRRRDEEREAGVERWADGTGIWEV